MPGPLYTAIPRHAVLVMAALAICAVTAALLKDRTDTQDPRSPLIRAPPAEPGMIQLTILEISRLLAARLLQPPPPGHATHWLNWRRRHQAAHAAATSAHNSPETAKSPWSASNWRLP